MAKLPKRPKAKRMPKKPKASASLSSWQRWEDRAKKVMKENLDSMRDYDRKVAQIKADEKKKAAIIKKAGTMKVTKK